MTRNVSCTVFERKENMCSMNIQILLIMLRIYEVVTRLLVRQDFKFGV